VAGRKYKLPAKQRPDGRQDREEAEEVGAEGEGQPLFLPTPPS